LEKEFEILGVPFNERGAMADEYLAAIIELWTSDSPCFEGKYVSFSDVAFEPKPVQKPHLPIWMGGDSDAALKRAARFASGWWPFLTPPQEISARIDFIKSQPEFRGGDFEVMYGLRTSRVEKGHVVREKAAEQPVMGIQEIVDGLSQLKDLGVTMSSVPIPPVKDVDAYLDYAQWVIEEIRPRVQ
jgi:alkanesulfonate monooxygenase SsuD/methylene tetrahydromethanopterin reductase-like flavin-dependent oxidoreductase (luciferase family)